MIFYITFLRALAACLITNAHYTGVYPNDLIANGGLLGDIIFFAVSGFSLYNIKTAFPKWYGKRLYRCYLPTLIITGIYVILGFYSFETNGVFWWFVYPTNYHFIASLILLYIPYYIIIKIQYLKQRLLMVFAVTVIAHIIVYCLFYDKSYYHIDNVREPLIWFLFMEAMLIGAWLRQNDLKFRNIFHWYYPVIMVFMAFLYFFSKNALIKTESLSVLQIFNQFILLGLLFSLLITFSSIDDILEKTPGWLKSIIKYLAEITLEIYLVQYVLIDLLRPIKRFPLNWLAISAAIIAAATVLHYICKGIMLLFDLSIKKMIGKEEL